MQAEVAATVDLAGDPEDVFAAVVDWEGQGRWIPCTRVRVAAGADGLGQRVVARTAVAGVGFDDPMTVTWWDPPHRCEVLHTGRVVRGSGAFVVDAVDGGSRFTWVERVRVPGGPLAPLVWRVARPVTSAALAWAQRRLARTIEHDLRTG